MIKIIVDNNIVTNKRKKPSSKKFANMKQQPNATTKTQTHGTKSLIKNFLSENSLTYILMVYALDIIPRTTVIILKQYGYHGDNLYLKAIYVNGITDKYKVPLIILGRIFFPVAWIPITNTEDILP
jgi:hypothetical protein